MRKIKLREALYILAEIHTREDRQTGFSYIHGSGPNWYCKYSDAEYLEAWRVVRKAIHLQTEPHDLKT